MPRWLSALLDKIADRLVQLPRALEAEARAAVDLEQPERDR